MAIPKKFQNQYRKASFEGITYKVGDRIKSFGATGYIQKVSAGGAWVLFRDYEAEVAWQDMTHVTGAAKPAAHKATRTATRSSAKPVPHQGNESNHTGESSRDDENSHTDCLDLLAKERSISEAERTRASALEVEVKLLREQNGRLELECKEDPGESVSVTPGGELIQTPEPSYIIAGGRDASVRRALKESDTVMVIAPRGLGFSGIDFNSNVRVVYPFSRAVAWIATDAWKRGYRDTEYSIYQVMRQREHVYAYSIDENQKAEKIIKVTKPSRDAVTVRQSANCRVEIVRIGSRDTVRIIFDHTPGKEATKQLKTQGFRYYHEKGTDLHYWGTFFTSQKLLFAKEFCGESPDQATAANAPNLSPVEPAQPRASAYTESEDVELVPEVPLDTESELARTASDETLPSEDDTTKDDLDKAESAMTTIESLLREALAK